jgi:hypothetical protein
VSAGALVRRRLTSQLLTGPPGRDAVTVAQRLLAVQAQDPRAARLAVRARTRGVSASDVDRALTEDRSLLITWLARGTLHLVAAEDYPWLQVLMTPQLRAGCGRRLAQESVSPADADRAVALIVTTIGDQGPCTRAELRDVLERAGIPVAGQALVHILFRASIDGWIVRGPIVGGDHAFVLVRDWLPELSPADAVDRESALAELARRYLAGHAPASERDLARWAGVALRDARAALTAIAGSIRAEGDQLELRDRARLAPLPPPRLLGGFEPTLVGWSSREWILGAHDAAIVTGGIFRGFALVDGRATATWTLDRGEVVLAPFEQLSGDVVAALEADGGEVLRFLSG